MLCSPHLCLRAFEEWIKDRQCNECLLAWHHPSSMPPLVCLWSCLLLHNKPKCCCCTTQIVRGVGGFDHESWRRFKDERRVEAASNFVDGDLVEAFLDLPPEKAREVVAGVWPGGEYSYEDVIRRVEELQRLH